ncbi:MAG: histidinol-phosphatase HisJ family protein [Clostridiales bacterium]|nr:histidinol-phosphatase HisJ family protein [Clostridiales bacterium]
MIINDMHVHTRYSIDSGTGMEQYCINAVQLGINTICFTDHLDSNINDDGFMYYNIDAYFKEFEETKAKYDNRLMLLSGLEFSEPHYYPDEFAAIQKYPYDFIIGSVHFFYNDMFPSQMAKNGVSCETCFAYYWDEVLKMVSFGGFDCVGHLDFPKRYYHNLVYAEDKVSEIFRNMILHDICPEINTSSLRRGLDQALPDLDLLTLYKRPRRKICYRRFRCAQRG